MLTREQTKPRAFDEQTRAAEQPKGCENERPTGPGKARSQSAEKSTQHSNAESPAEAGQGRIHAPTGQALSTSIEELTPRRIEKPELIQIDRSARINKQARRAVTALRALKPFL